MDSLVGRASDWRYEGRVFDPCSSHFSSKNMILFSHTMIFIFNLMYRLTSYCIFAIDVTNTCLLHELYYSTILSLCVAPFHQRLYLCIFHLSLLVISVHLIPTSHGIIERVRKGLKIFTLFSLLSLIWSLQNHFKTYTVLCKKRI